jgi:hypothetical protein
VGIARDIPHAHSKAALGVGGGGFLPRPHRLGTLKTDQTTMTRRLQLFFLLPAFVCTREQIFFDYPIPNQPLMEGDLLVSTQGVTDSRARLCFYQEDELESFGCANDRFVKVKGLAPGTYNFTVRLQKNLPEQQAGKPLRFHSNRHEPVASTQLHIVDSSEPHIREEWLDQVEFGDTSKLGLEIASKYIGAVKKSMQRAMINQSKLSGTLGNFVMDIEGMSGSGFRHFLNNLCAEKEWNYLEIGNWKGSTACSCLAHNSVNAVFVDNWSQFKGPKDVFAENLQRCKEGNQVQTFDQSCWEMASELEQMPKFNLYLFDGPHTKADHYNAIAVFARFLEDVSIILVDDWNYPNVREATLRAIKDEKLVVMYKLELIAVESYWTDYGFWRKTNWHNGLGVFVVSKVPVT